MEGYKNFLPALVWVLDFSSLNISAISIGSDWEPSELLMGSVLAPYRAFCEIPPLFLKVKQDEYIIINN